MVMQAGQAGPGAGGAVFSGDAKRSASQHFGTPNSGQLTSLTKGDPLSRSMNQYKKGHSFTGPSTVPTTANPTAAMDNPGSSMGPMKAPKIGEIRGGQGTMKKNARSGGLGPGPMSAPGGAGDYSMTSPDAE